MNATDDWKPQRPRRRRGEKDFFFISHLAPA